MRETYTKRGTSVRIERSGRSISTVVTREHGIATRERGRLRVDSLGERSIATAPDVAGATDVARRLASLEGSGVAVERLTVVAGLAEHAVEGDGPTAAWTEEIARVHLSLVDRDRALRIAVDLGARSPGELRLDVATEAADALRLPSAGSLPEGDRVELAPAVAAALWRFLAEHPSLTEGSRLRIDQSKHPSWPFDGSGSPVSVQEIGASAPTSVFRPSYRIAPVPAWFHLNASLRGAGRARGRRHPPTRIVALLRPFRLTRSSVSARVLATSGGRSAPAELDIPRTTLGSAFVRMAGDAIWFPFDAGAWGRSTEIEGARLTTME